MILLDYEGIIKKKRNLEKSLQEYQGGCLDALGRCGVYSCFLDRFLTGVQIRLGVVGKGRTGA